MIRFHCCALEYATVCLYIYCWTLGCFHSFSSSDGAEFLGACVQRTSSSGVAVSVYLQLPQTRPRCFSKGYMPFNSPPVMHCFPGLVIT